MRQFRSTVIGDADIMILDVLDNSIYYSELSRSPHCAEYRTRKQNLMIVYLQCPSTASTLTTRFDVAVNMRKLKGIAIQQRWLWMVTATYVKMSSSPI